MLRLAVGSGLTPQFLSPPSAKAEAETEITEEAGLTGPPLRIVPLVEEGALVAQGAPVARLRDAPSVCFAAPMPARVARIRLMPGHRLSEVIFFREAVGDRLVHTEKDQRSLIQSAGLWPLFRRRPFGGMPSAGELPAAIVVMAADSRPLAPDPAETLRGRQEALGRGLHALTKLTDGPVFFVQDNDASLVEKTAFGDRIRRVTCGSRHPNGLAGFRIHDLCPAGVDLPVWDIHAEDVAAIGDLLSTGLVAETRVIHIAGPGLRESRLVRTQPGADLRGLTRRIVLPGPHTLLSGSPLDGERAQWLGPRDRQASVMPRQDGPTHVHWLRRALTHSTLPAPVIPTAALTQSLGAALPAAAFVRALVSGDDEAAMSLGVLSLLEEDLALADYVLGGDARLRTCLRVMLDRIRTELAS